MQSRVCGNNNSMLIQSLPDVTWHHKNFSFMFAYWKCWRPRNKELTNKLCSPFLQEVWRVAGRSSQLERCPSSALAVGQDCLPMRRRKKRKKVGRREQNPWSLPPVEDYLGKMTMMCGWQLAARERKVCLYVSCSVQLKLVSSPYPTVLQVKVWWQLGAFLGVPSQQSRFWTSQWNSATSFNHRH